MQHTILYVLPRSEVSIGHVLQCRSYSRLVTDRAAKDLTKPGTSPFRFAIAASFTAEPLQNFIAFWGSRLASDFELRFAPYNQVLQTYPTTNSVPDALYKRGLAQERLGQSDAARASFETVVKQYPETDAGRLARQNLDRLAARRP